ncbi:MAG: type II toxin-antitoxin system RelE/ParE family toxin [Dysgonamonadaceae bacterium]|jgi:mRNA interferase RelE/StbE|nr:type II toxin-antitoxin system RelE/ParE family toxin [Dysgonamonadaceae bacterium]
MYRVIISKQLLKSLDKISVVYLSGIKKAINDLENNPRPFGSLKLSGSKNTYRIRVGIYRIIYTIKDDILTVEVVKMDNRDSVYKYPPNIPCYLPKITLSTIKRSGSGNITKRLKNALF